MNFRLEICADSIESAINAQSAGAHRIELCDNLQEGGTTPSCGLISSARENLNIGLNVLIRPRSGDFCYEDPDFDIMRRDIEMCGEIGADGVVLGILRDDGSIDTERTGRLIELAQPMEVTFHRAFDMCCQPFDCLEELISAGVSRVLTSGLARSAHEGSEMLRELVARAESRLIVMPGGGLDESNIAAVALKTGASEFHMSLRSAVESRMKFRNNSVHMGNPLSGNEYSRKIADPDRIKTIISILKMI
jgi:copper homeostasis protein